jgi:hypothetical protein
MNDRSKRGPRPDRVKLDEDWEEAVKKALKKKRPEGGWPKHEQDKKKSK